MSLEKNTICSQCRLFLMLDRLILEKSIRVFK